MHCRKFISIFVLTFWSLALFHCIVEKATAHWHLKDNKAQHHHHPFNSDGSHDHSPYEEPIGGHSHHSGDSECCEFSRAALPQGKILGVHVTSFGVDFLPHSFIALHRKIDGKLLSSRYPLKTQRAIFNESEFLTKTLKIPNAPPMLASV